MDKDEQACSNFKADDEVNILLCVRCGWELKDHKTHIETESIPAIPNDLSFKQVSDIIIDYLSCTEEITKKFIEQALSDIETFDNKQHDYGPGNIAKFGEQGVLVRVSDKVERLINLSLSEHTAKNESVEDSWKDISIYGIIARICRRGDWL